MAKASRRTKLSDEQLIPISPLQSGAERGTDSARALLRVSLQTLVSVVRQPDNRRVIAVNRRERIYALSPIWFLSTKQVYGSWLTDQIGLLKQIGIIEQLPGQTKRMRHYRIPANAVALLDSVSDADLERAWIFYREDIDPRRKFVVIDGGKSPTKRMTAVIPRTPNQRTRRRVTTG